MGRAFQRGGVFIAAGGGEQSSGRVLSILKFIEDFVGRAIKNAVAVGKSGGYEGRRRAMFLRWKKAVLVMIVLLFSFPVVSMCCREV